MGWYSQKQALTPEFIPAGIKSRGTQKSTSESIGHLSLKFAPIDREGLMTIRISSLHKEGASPLRWAGQPALARETEPTACLIDRDLQK
jgi:hypothetical protein